MKVTWVTRSFLDYRIPVFAEMGRILGDRFRLIFSREYVPERVVAKVRDALGDRAVGLTGEWKLGGEDRHCRANRNLSFRFHPGAVRAVWRSRPDVVVGDGFFKWTLAGILYRVATGTPLVICYERTGHTERNSQWFRTFYRRAVVRLSGAMCCNGSLSAAYAKWLGVPEARVTLGNMAADTETMRRLTAAVTDGQREALRRRWSSRRVQLLYVGRLIGLKGLRELLEAWRGLPQAHMEQASLLLIGAGEEEEPLRRFCAQEGLANVHFVGEVDHDELAPFYASADVFIIPTLEDNWSLVVPEAMASGLPVLCSQYNGCWPELVHEGVNGWVFDPLDSHGTTAKLSSCIENAGRLAGMGQASQRIVESHTPAKAAAAILAACEIATRRTR